VAQRIRSTMRADDLVVRMGGDEFVVVMRGIRSTQQVNDAAARINRALSAPMVVDGRTLVTTVGIGVALYPYDGADMGELLRHSDTAMYQAKDRGRNNYQLFRPSMDKRLKERIAIESSLRTALQSREFDVHYQPIVDIESQRGRARGTHALEAPERAIEDMARWRQAEGRRLRYRLFEPLVPQALAGGRVQSKDTSSSRCKSDRGQKTQTS
jgi:predicted signal transduction protein with EAL and GGDEF domain